MKDGPFDIRKLLGSELVNIVNRLPDNQPRVSVNFSESGCFSGWTVREEAHGEDEPVCTLKYPALDLLKTG